MLIRKSGGPKVRGWSSEQNIPGSRLCNFSLSSLLTKSRHFEFDIYWAPFHGLDPVLKF
jgi:hypothetical protein